MKYVIIGNSTAAIGCIEGIREVDRQGEITVISSEKYHTYSRPLISYLLCSKTDLERMKYRPDSFYDDNGCKTLFDKTVTEINAKDKYVALNGGEKISYDKLMVATGSRPFVPPFEGLEKVKNKTGFTTLDDALTLEKMLTPQSRVLIVGAGLIGLKCAEGIADRVGHITVCDMADRILPMVLDTEASSMVQAHMETKNISFYLSNSVKTFSENSAVLNNGETVDFDILVTAVGVRPNTQLLSDAGGKVNRGIVIDASGKTSLADIYAAGDCTECCDITTDENRIIAILPNAYMQGKCAGMDMAGKPAVFDKSIAMNAGGFFGMHIITAGNYDGEAHILRGNGTYKKLIVKDNLLKGFILVGDVARAGIYTELIRKKVPLDTLNFKLILEKPQLMAFSRNDRDKIFRGQAI